MSRHQHDEQDSHHYILAGKKLAWLANPVIAVDKPQPPVDIREFDDLQDLESSKTDYNTQEIPRFEKHGASSNFEVFYDLWFVANLAIFTSLHTVNELVNLWSYVGYISLLWFDWFLVSIYDVRYLADSVFERMARAVHMGVMVGFAVVSVNFTPENQSKVTFQVTSLILMVSRLVLAVRYSSIIWHIRHFKKGKTPFVILVALNIIAALIYLGVSFRFTGGKNSRAFTTWYVVGAIEALSQIGLSLYFKVLSFNDTHLTERMTVSTLFMLAEGVNVLAENVVTIVTNNGWTPPTIGNLTSGISVVYFVFMIYFDWMANHHHLTGVRQALWTLLHFPFHIFLLIFIEGATQFVQWWKIIESLNYAGDQIIASANKINEMLKDVPEDAGTQTVVDTLNETVWGIWDKYTPTYSLTYEAIEQTLGNLSTIPNGYWYNDDFPDTEKYDDIWGQDIDDLLETVSNSIFQNYKIDPIMDVVKKATDNATDSAIQNAAFESTLARFVITYEFTFVAAGLTLVLMVLLFSVARGPRRFWTWSVGLRMGLFLVAGIALSLLSLVTRSDGSDYPFSPWLLPTLSLIFFLVLVLTHFPRRPPSWPFLSWRRARRSAKGRDADTRYEHVRDQHVLGYQGAFEGQTGYGGQPTHIYSASYPLETYAKESGTGYGKTSRAR